MNFNAVPAKLVTGSEILVTKHNITLYSKYKYCILIAKNDAKFRQVKYKDSGEDLHIVAI